MSRHAAGQQLVPSVPRLVLLASGHAVDASSHLSRLDRSGAKPPSSSPLPHLCGQRLELLLGRHMSGLPQALHSQRGGQGCMQPRSALRQPQQRIARQTLGCGGRHLGASWSRSRLRASRSTWRHLSRLHLECKLLLCCRAGCQLCPLCARQETHVQVCQYTERCCGAAGAAVLGRGVARRMTVRNATTQPHVGRLATPDAAEVGRGGSLAAAAEAAAPRPRGPTSRSGAARKRSRPSDSCSASAELCSVPQAYSRRSRHAASGAPDGGLQALCTEKRRTRVRQAKGVRCARLCEQANQGASWHQA